jgi:hypothetical protein
MRDFRRCVRRTGERTVAWPHPGAFSAEVDSSILLNLKPFGLGTAHKEREILGGSDALGLSMTTRIESDAAGWVKSEVFHSNEKARTRVANPERTQLNP